MQTHQFTNDVLDVAFLPWKRGTHFRRLPPDAANLLTPGLANVLTQNSYPTNGLQPTPVPIPIANWWKPELSDNIKAEFHVAPYKTNFSYKQVFIEVINLHIKGTPNIINWLRKMPLGSRWVACVRLVGNVRYLVGHGSGLLLTMPDAYDSSGAEAMLHLKLHSQCFRLTPNCTDNFLDDGYGFNVAMVTAQPAAQTSLSIQPFLDMMMQQF